MSVLDPTLDGVFGSDRVGTLKRGQPLEGAQTSGRVQALADVQTSEGGPTLDRIASRYDVIIAGARVAGAATALLLARAGIRVLMVDPRPPRRDTLSTHALMRGGVLQLHRWGLLDGILCEDTPPIRATVFDYGHEQITVPIKERDGLGVLVAPRRTVLDPLLNQAAAAAGADIVYGARVADLMVDPAGRVVGARITTSDGGHASVRADMVVGADGRNSRVARLVCARVERVSRHSTASIYAYLPTAQDPDDRYLWRFAPAGPGSTQPAVMMGEIPTNAGESCIFASTTPAVFRAAGRRRMAELFAATVRRMNPDLADRIEATGGLTPRGFAGARGVLRRPVGPGWALVGDSGHFRDPCTAHGMTDALRDAEALAHAIMQGTSSALERFGQERDEISVGLFEVTDAIAGLEWGLEEVQQLHHQLSREMNRGVEQIEGFAGLPAGLSLQAPG